VLQGGRGSPTSIRTECGSADHLLNVREVAKLLGASTASVYKLIERGHLVHVRISNAIRVRPDDLEYFIQGHRS
jgi:excisionase family DNA binding protein